MTLGGIVLAAAIAGSSDRYLARLRADARLPRGFSVSTTSFAFSPVEQPGQRAQMALTLLHLDQPTESFGAVFTRNALPGAPVLVGKTRMDNERLQAVLINNKIANVCAGGSAGGVADSESVCAALADRLGFACGGQSVVPCSTGIIGWRLPVEDIRASLGALAQGLQKESALPAAESIMTTDCWPKVRAARACGGRIVAIAKGAGMIEPNMATMLGFIMTDVAVPREDLRWMLAECADLTFNCISVDGDQSTSDTVLALSSRSVPFDSTAEALNEFRAALQSVCAGLAADIVRNGEGVQHVINVTVTGARSADDARRVGKAVVNSNLFKCAVAGNDPNVGRIIAAIGSCAGATLPADDAPLLVDRCRVSMGGRLLFKHGQFRLSADEENALFAYLCDAELPPPPEPEDLEAYPFPEHERSVCIEVDLGLGDCGACVLGADLTREYVDINADYRS